MGGNVWADTNKIENADEFIYVVKTLSNILKIPLIYFEFSLLGSAQGLRTFPISDLDINMDKDIYDLYHIMNILKTHLGENSAHNQGNTIYCRVALGTKVYQVDFMFGDYKWQQFAYAGARDSKFKGVHRNMLIKSYAALISDQTVFEKDELVARAGWTFLVQTGLVYRYRHRHFKRDGVNRVKTFSELILTDWNDFYREGMEPFTQPPTIITDPDVAMRTLFSVDADDRIFWSFENLRDYIRNNISPEKYVELSEIYAKMCEDNRVLCTHMDMK